MKAVWLDQYPENVPAEIDPDQYGSVEEMFAEAVERYGDQVAYSNFGRELTFTDLDRLSSRFAAFLQEEDFGKGDRLAIQLPNILQYPVVLFGAIKAGVTAVNTNPLYSSRELAHQYGNSGATGLVVIANEAQKVEGILDETEIRTVVVTEIGDLFGFPKRPLINAWLRYVKRMVPDYDLDDAVTLREALGRGESRDFRPVDIEREDPVFLQYTGGTTGTPKGAVLTQRNLVANTLQISAWMQANLERGEETAIAALPLYHIFALTLNCFAMTYFGAGNILITDPRDIGGFVKTLKSKKFTLFPGLDTLFKNLLDADGFDEIDFSTMKLSIAGGMALKKSVGERWKAATGAPVVEGYGLTEASPVVSCNPTDGRDKPGTIGLPLPSTEVMLCDDDGNEITDTAEAGELCVRGPQVMQAYWNLPEETEATLSEDGWLRTGDMARVDEEGYFEIVDRKKDMILVSGFNVYPNEVEDVIAELDDVKEVAAVGVDDEKSTEAVKVFVVRDENSLTERELIDYCKQEMADYKVPKHVEFRDEELPKNDVGKILRRELQDDE